METTSAVSAFCTLLEGNTQRTAKAAEQGDAATQRNLGLMYLNGDGVPKDIGMVLTKGSTE